MNKRITLKTSSEVYNSKSLSNLNESVTKTEDGYMVKTFVEVPQSLVRAIVSKAKTETGKDPKEMLGDTDIAELIVQYLHKTFLNADSIPSSAVLFSSEKKATTAQPAQPTAQPTVPVQNAEPVAQPVQGEEELPVGTVQENASNGRYEYTVFGSFASDKELSGKDIDNLQGMISLQIEEPQEYGENGMEDAEWSSSNVEVYIKEK